ncbi:anti-sigma-I factor RsgI family protein [Oceanirhabdus sp. W0125-5]|uniref:anti-sigma-I factor RsgI family protein n=1 Tax=Oceanirhabdus sp. W0125-5 TaxID=2999116 RepID=UPI0022F33B98|nr:hypothetical protein [Oceanirhabdus sp. W0125-5]WBW97380.1 hypothetical protein OW730_00570 [Oceanirhabdus sp. W0125-5]
MKKSGKVMNVKGSKVYILTPEDEFAIVKINSITPVKGELYTGYEFYEMHKGLKLLIFFILIMGLAVSIYFIKYTKATTSFIINMNAEFKINVNKDNKVVKIEALNSKGKSILNTSSFFNKNYNDTLKRLYNVCTAKDYFSKEYLSRTPYVIIYINATSQNINLDFTEFEEYLNFRKLDLIINQNGKSNK